MGIDDVAKSVEELKIVSGSSSKTGARVNAQRDWPVGYELTATWANDEQRKKLIDLARDYSDYVKWDSEKVTVWVLLGQVAALVFVKAAKIAGADMFFSSEENDHANLF